jgi:hypothetical protein
MPSWRASKPARDGGTVRAELLTAARDDRLGRLQGDAKLGEDVGGERVGNTEHAEQDVLGAERLPFGVVERVGERLLSLGPMPREAGTRSSAPGPNVSSSRSRTAWKSIPSVASASASILGAPPPMQGERGSSTASAVTPTS